MDSSFIRKHLGRKKRGRSHAPEKYKRHLVLNPYLQHLAMFRADDGTVFSDSVWSEDVVPSIFFS